MSRLERSGRMELDRSGVTFGSGRSMISAGP